MYKVILWDIDGTLLDFKASEKAAIRFCFEKFQLGVCSDEMLARYTEINHGYWKKLECGEIAKQEVLIGRFRDFFAQEGLDESKAEAFNNEYQVRLGDTVVFRDNSFSLVKSLKDRVKQYATTNGTEVAQKRKLRNSKFDELLDGVFISDQIGYEKPNKKFFDVVFEQIGQVPKEEIMIVGDSLTSDIRGGNNAGIKTCWYNPNHESNMTGEKVDYEISDLNEILHIID